MLALLSNEAQSALVKLIDERVAHHLAAADPTEAASPWMTVPEAADHLRTTPAALYKRIERGQLPFYRPEGSRILLRREDITGPGS